MAESINKIVVFTLEIISRYDTTNIQIRLKQLGFVKQNRRGGDVINTFQ